MGVTYEEMVRFSQTFGLLYFMALAAIVVAYAYWPSNRAVFDRAASAILDDEDKPCR